MIIKYIRTVQNTQYNFTRTCMRNESYLHALFDAEIIIITGIVFFISYYYNYDNRLSHQCGLEYVIVYVSNSNRNI